MQTGNGHPEGLPASRGRRQKGEKHHLPTLKMFQEALWISQARRKWVGGKYNRVTTASCEAPRPKKTYTVKEAAVER